MFYTKVAFKIKLVYLFNRFYYNFFAKLRSYVCSKQLLLEPSKYNYKKKLSFLATFPIYVASVHLLHKYT